MGSNSLLVIDGSFGEGGGQVLRNSLALSILTDREIRIENIRANRTPPGLKAQHRAAVRGAATICGARVTGDEIGSSVVEFKPGAIRPGDHSIDIGTAGSVTLLLQTLLPPLLSAEGPSTLRLTGGTDVSWSPPLDYLRYVFLPKIRSMGAQVEIGLERRGFFPKGGGEIVVRVNPGTLRPGEFLPHPDLDEVKEISGEKMSDQAYSGRIEGRVFLGNLPGHIGERMKETAEQVLIREFGEETDIRITIAPPGENEGEAFGQGTGITLWTVASSVSPLPSPDPSGNCVGYGASALGRKGLRAEHVGRDAARDLILEINEKCGVDIHTADQLPVFAPLVAVPGQGTRLHYSVREISGHLRSALWVLEQFGYPSTTIYQDGFQVML